MKNSTLHGLQEVGLLILPFMLCIEFLTVPTMSIAVLTSAIAGAPLVMLIIMTILMIPSLLNMACMLFAMNKKVSILKSIREGVFLEKMVENNIHANLESTWLTTWWSITAVPLIIIYFVSIDIEGKFAYLALGTQFLYACGVLIPFAISSTATWLLRHKKV